MNSGISGTGDSVSAGTDLDYGTSSVDVTSFVDVSNASSGSVDSSVDVAVDVAGDVDGFSSGPVPGPVYIADASSNNVAGDVNGYVNGTSASDGPGSVTGDEDGDRNLFISLILGSIPLGNSTCPLNQSTGFGKSIDFCSSLLINGFK